MIFSSTKICNILFSKKYDFVLVLIWICEVDTVCIAN